MQQIQNDRQAQHETDEKKAYTRPELVKHGQVETLTQLINNPTSSQLPA